MNRTVTAFVIATALAGGLAACQRDAADTTATDSAMNEGLATTPPADSAPTAMDSAMAPADSAMAPADSAAMATPPVNDSAAPAS